MDQGVAYLPAVLRGLQQAVANQLVHGFVTAQLQLVRILALPQQE